MQKSYENPGYQSCITIDSRLAQINDRSILWEYPNLTYKHMETNNYTCVDS